MRGSPNCGLARATCGDLGDIDAGVGEAGSLVLPAEAGGKRALGVEAGVEPGGLEVGKVFKPLPIFGAELRHGLWCQQPEQNDGFVIGILFLIGWKKKK